MVVTCGYCGNHNLIWGSDFDIDDIYDNEGIASCYTCPECGSNITITTMFNEEGEEDDN